MNHSNHIYFEDFLGSKTAWIFGRTPPLAIVTPPSNLFSSSSFFTARVMWRGTIRLFLLSRAAFPASSKISAHKYSNTAARYTGAPAPIRVAYFPVRRYRPIRPTGNCKPALADAVVDFFAPRPPFPFPKATSKQTKSTKQNKQKKTKRERDVSTDLCVPILLFLPSIHYVPDMVVCC